MHNLHANFINFLDICKRFAEGLVDKNGNARRRGAVPRFSDVEVVALGMTAEHCGIDSEGLLFKRLGEYSGEFPNLISRRQFNDRRKTTAELGDRIRRRIAEEIDSGRPASASTPSPARVRDGKKKQVRNGQVRREKRACDRLLRLEKDILLRV